MSKSEQSVLVVVEGDAACPFWMEHWGSSPTGDWSMLEQEEWETAPAFMDRLEATLGRVCDPETTVILVTSARSDAMALGARWNLSSALMAHLAQLGGAGRLVLTRGFGQCSRPAGVLADLAQELAEASDDAVDVVVRLAEQPPISEVRTWGPARSAPTADYGVAAAQ